MKTTLVVHMLLLLSKFKRRYTIQLVYIQAHGYLNIPISTTADREHVIISVTQFSLNFLGIDLV